MARGRVSRRVADVSKLVWSVTRGAVSQKRRDSARSLHSLVVPRRAALFRCVDFLRKLEGAPVSHLTIHQCEALIREIEKQKCDKFLLQAEAFLKKGSEPAEAAPRPRASPKWWWFWDPCASAF